MSISSVPGFDALQAAPASSSFAGQDVLSAPVTQTPAPSTTPAAPAASTAPATDPTATPTTASTTAPAATTNPYQTAYDQIEAASSAALLQSIGPAASAPSALGDGSGSSSLTGVSAILSALREGYDQGFFTGTGFDHLG